MENGRKRAKPLSLSMAASLGRARRKQPPRQSAAAAKRPLDVDVFGGSSAGSGSDEDEDEDAHGGGGGGAESTAAMSVASWRDSDEEGGGGEGRSTHLSMSLLRVRKGKSERQVALETEATQMLSGLQTAYELEEQSMGSEAGAARAAAPLARVQPLQVAREERIEFEVTVEDTCDALALSRHSGAGLTGDEQRRKVLAAMSARLDEQTQRVALEASQRLAEVSLSERGAAGTEQVTPMHGDEKMLLSEERVDALLAAAGARGTGGGGGGGEEEFRAPLQSQREWLLALAGERVSQQEEDFLYEAERSYHGQGLAPPPEMLALPELPRLNKYQCAELLREPDVAVGERECANGQNCLCLMLSQATPGAEAEAESQATAEAGAGAGAAAPPPPPPPPERSSTGASGTAGAAGAHEGFVCREMLLPDEQEAWLASGLTELPAEPRLCLVCNRAETHARVQLNAMKTLSRVVLACPHDHTLEWDTEDGYSSEFAVEVVCGPRQDRTTGAADRVLVFSRMHYRLSQCESPYDAARRLACYIEDGIHFHTAPADSGLPASGTSSAPASATPETSACRTDRR